LNDLVKQKEKIEQEINRLVEYLKEGESTILNSEDVNKNVSDKPNNFSVLGE
jgi:hypothetical protein